MDEVTSDFPQINEIADSIRFKVLNDIDETIKYCDEISYINKQLFLMICKLYSYPITVVYQIQYTDKMYRDAYYVYLSHLHFDIERHCQRLALFKGKVPFINFFDSDCHLELQDKFLGTMVIRPSYNHSTEYTLGRTLLNPYKLEHPLHYIRTARYKVTVCGQTYIVNAFPFSNQHGDVLRCAETSVWSLMEYYGTRYENYRIVLPSTILDWASKELPERSLPSDGLTYSQISSLLKTFNFEPRIYERNAYINKAKILKEELFDKWLAAKDLSGLLEIELEEEDFTKEREDIDKKQVIFANSKEIEAEKIADEIDKAIKNNLQSEQEESEKRAKEKGEIRQLSLHNLLLFMGWGNV